MKIKTLLNSYNQKLEGARHRLKKIGIEEGATIKEIEILEDIVKKLSEIHANNQKAEETGSIETECGLHIAQLKDNKDFCIDEFVKTTDESTSCEFDSSKIIKGGLPKEDKNLVVGMTIEERIDKAYERGFFTKLRTSGCYSQKETKTLVDKARKELTKKIFQDIKQNVVGCYRCDNRTDSLGGCSYCYQDIESVEQKYIKEAN